LLLSYLDLLQTGFLLFLTFFGSAVTALVVGIAFHEFSHALVANLLGDDTAKRMGRVSLNPVRHLDPTGTAMLLIGGFGWGKPVQVNGYRLRNGPKAGGAMVAAAGPVSNLLLAGVAGLPIQTGLLPWRSPFLVPFSVAEWSATDYLGLYVAALLIFNVVLAVFNLIPLAPLDGFAVAVGLLPQDLARSFARLREYGPGILLLLLVLPFLTQGRVSILHEVMAPAINALTGLLAGGDARALG
jgi:Zn-dependent protease